MIDLSKVTITDFDGIDDMDYPDFCDAYASEAEYDGEPMTQEQLDELNEHHNEYVYERLMDFLF